MANYTVMAMGNGDYLVAMFNAIASLMGDKSVMKNILSICGMLGLAWGVSKTVYGNALKALGGWAVTFYAASAILLTPKATVIIKDSITNHTRSVANVPLGLAAFAGTVSKASYLLTKKIDQAFTHLHDYKYHETGHIMASNIIAESKNFVIHDSNLRLSLRDFFKNCVFYTALRGHKYTVNDLMHSSDIWKLVKNNASVARHCKIIGIGNDEPTGGDGASGEADGIRRGQVTTCSCKVAADYLDSHLSREIEGAYSSGNKRVFGSGNRVNNQLKALLPVSLNVMTGMASSATDSMRQLLMVSTYNDSHAAWGKDAGSRFAVNKARLQKRESEMTIWGLADITTVTLKNVLEVLIYAAFLFVIPIMALPIGWRFLSNWGSMVLWINLWAPLYAITNMISNLGMKKYAAGSVMGDTGITIYNSVGVMGLHADMAAKAGSLGLAVGSLSYMLAKGGASAMMHLAGHMTSIGSGAAAQAGVDKMRGDFSWGNVSENSIASQNKTFLQQNMSPNIKGGGYTQSDDIWTESHSMGGESAYSHNQSKFSFDLNFRDEMGKKLAQNYRDSSSNAESLATDLSQSEQQVNNTALEFSTNHANSISSGENYSTNMSSQTQESVNETNKLVDQFAHDNSLRRDVSKKLLAYVGTPGGDFFGAKAQANFEGSNVDAETFSKAKNYSQEHGFNEQLQKTAQLLKGESFSSNNSEQNALAEKLSALSSKTDSLTEKHGHALNRQKSFEQLQDVFKSNSGTISNNLNNKFMSWLQEQKLPNSNSAMGTAEAKQIVHTDASGMRSSYINKFMDQQMVDVNKLLNKDGNLNHQAIAKNYGIQSDNLKNQYNNNSVGINNDVIIANASNAGINSNSRVNNNLKTVVESGLVNADEAINSTKNRIINTGGQRQKLSEYKAPETVNVMDDTLGIFKKNFNDLTGGLLNSDREISHEIQAKGGKANNQSFTDIVGGAVSDTLNSVTFGMTNTDPNKNTYGYNTNVTPATSVVALSTSSSASAIQLPEVNIGQNTSSAINELKYTLEEQQETIESLQDNKRVAIPGVSS